MLLNDISYFKRRGSPAGLRHRRLPDRAGVRRVALRGALPRPPGEPPPGQDSEGTTCPTLLILHMLSSEMTASLANYDDP